MTSSHLSRSVDSKPSRLKCFNIDIFLTIVYLFFQDIGKALKELCTSLTHELTVLPDQFHREIDMAQKTTNKDLSQIINQTKLVRKFFNTTQVDDYKKCKSSASLLQNLFKH